MSKEIYISSTPHETRLAIVENDALTEIYYERENEYTLAGSIYNGKVTRVLPGMQSSFVDIGLERDAFLYITDFMEEAPDSAEFETTSIGEGGSRVPRLEARTEQPQREAQESQPRVERGERNERSGRSSRGRGRGDRSGQGERTPATEQSSELPLSEFEMPRVLASSGGVEASANQDEELPVDSAEVGEGAPGADGSRRWRGRRGRRRGRGPVGNAGVRDESPQTTSAGSEHTDFAAETENHRIDEAFEAGESFAEPDEIATPAALPAVTLAAPQGVEQPYGRRNEGGRGDRGRDRDRGRSDRGGRGGRDGRPARVPRGFAPSTSLYGVDSSTLDEGGTDAPAEPIILPGESLSKYRKGSEGEVAAVAVAASAPSNEYALAPGWDGGSVLPGESLSRHRRSETRTEPYAEHRVVAPVSLTRPATQNAPEPVYAAAVVQEEDGPSVAETPETQPEVALAAHPELVPETETIHEESTATEPTSQAVPEPTGEYEPQEGFASYKVDPIAPSEYRQAAPVDDKDNADLVQGPSEAEVLESLKEQPGTSEFGNTHFLTPAPIGPEPILLDETKTIAEEETEGLGRAVGDMYLFEPAVEPITGTPLPGHDVTMLNPMGEMVSMPPVAEPALVPAPLEQPEPSAPIHHEGAVLTPDESLEEFDEPEDGSTQTFEPGQGDLEEELIEEEEYEIAALHAGYDDEMDDLEEETLEGAADLGTMLREMSIDQITRTAPEREEDEDLEEESLEEGDEERRPTFEREEQLDEDSEEYARTAESAGDFSNEFREPESNDAPAGAVGSYAERRGGRRDVRRGGRDRDPRRGSDSSGRPRNMGGSGDADRGRSGRTNGGRMGRGSMQSTNLPAISELLKPGQEILVQIAKEPIAKKGARITSHIALPGRFLVFMPTVNHTGVSRKIESEGERRRLKDILLSEKGEAAGGFIVRTAASGASEEELRSDLRFLLNLWADIKNRSESSKSPALIYHDLNLVERILRDQVTDTFSAIWVDTETEYERVLRFLQRFQPSLIRRVKLYLKETPLFEQFGITEEINKALRSKVWLKSGGSIVINQTEALVAIDINTGKFVGKTARLEDTIVKTNLDAIPEIVRQIRLRDLGGIIIIDFIDMDERKNRNKVMAALEEELKSDRAPSKVLQFNDFGLVAITRKRVKQSLERTLSTTCNVCVGTGMVKSPVTVCNDIYIEMRKMYKHLDKGDVMLRVHPEVVKQLKSTGTRWLQEMEEMSGKTILIKSDPSLHPEQFDIH